MVEKAKTPNVVKATNVDGLADSLQGLMDDLTKCEKALAEYLDTKRLAFPRYSGRRAINQFIYQSRESRLVPAVFLTAQFLQET